MEWLFLPLFITIFICVFILIKQKRKITKIENETFNSLNEQRLRHIRSLEEQVKLLETERHNVECRLADKVQHEIDIVKANVEGARALEMTKMQTEIEEQKQRELAKVKEIHESVMSQMLNEQVELSDLLIPLRKELAEYRAKREAINQSIQRERSIEMEKDFHRIILNDESKEDISYLLSIEQKIHNKEILRKLIYETYVRPPLLEMEKRVLDNKEFSGIYKITDNTGRIYIGKAVNIKARWQAHAKEALGIGGISHSAIHNALRQRGWDNFTWEVLEQCNKDDLTVREHYYIDFYESKVVGYNIKG